MSLANGMSGWGGPCTCSPNGPTFHYSNWIVGSSFEDNRSLFFCPTDSHCPMLIGGVLPKCVKGFKTGSFIINYPFNASKKCARPVFQIILKLRNV